MSTPYHNIIKKNRMVNPYIVGKHVYLRHPTEEDAMGKWHEWYSDEETTKYLIDQWWPNSIENQMDIYRSLVDDWNRGSRIKLVLSVIKFSSLFMFI